MIQNLVLTQTLKPLIFTPLDVADEEVPEKVGSTWGLVAQALLPVRVLLELTRAHRQECLCYTTFSPTCEDTTHNDFL